MKLSHTVKTALYLLYVFCLIGVTLLGLVVFTQRSGFHLTGYRGRALHLSIAELESLRAQVDCTRPVHFYCKQKTLQIGKGIILPIQLVRYAFAPCHIVAQDEQPLVPGQGYALIHNSHGASRSPVDNSSLLSKTENYILIEFDSFQ